MPNSEPVTKPGCVVRSEHRRELILRPNADAVDVDPFPGIADLNASSPSRFVYRAAIIKKELRLFREGIHIRAVVFRAKLRHKRKARFSAD